MLNSSNLTCICQDNVKYWERIQNAQNYLSNGNCKLHVCYHVSGVWSDPDLQDLIPDSFDYICTRISQSETQQYLVRPDVGVYVMVSRVK